MRRGRTVLTLLLVAGCTPAKPRKPETATAIPAAASPSIDAVAASRATSTRPASEADAGRDARPEPELARWTLETPPSSSRRTTSRIEWQLTRSAGKHAPPRVLRGVIRPASQEPLGLCDEDLGVPEGARGLTSTLHISLEGAVRPLHVWALARGNLGMSVNRRCAKANANRPLRMDPDPDSPVEVRFGEVDRPGERSGRTFPFVLVVSDDVVEPTELPDPPATLAADVVSVRWSLARTSCPSGMDPWRCWKAALELGGAVQQTVPLAHPLLGQSGCWPEGMGILCGGASGQGLLSVIVSPEGKGVVSDYSESDGYCPDDAGCGTRTTLATFTVPAGVKLAPDPAGTFPAARP